MCGAGFFGDTVNTGAAPPCPRRRLRETHPRRADTRGRERDAETHARRRSRTRDPARHVPPSLGEGPRHARRARDTGTRPAGARPTAPSARDHVKIRTREATRVCPRRPADRPLAGRKSARQRLETRTELAIAAARRPIRVSRKSARRAELGIAAAQALRGGVPARARLRRGARGVGLLHVSGARASGRPEPLRRAARSRHC